ncbi:hypothetical protein QBC40DRAFT_289948 [Triangularia verruculosa]|uniref:Secreted protein n=1 Tax=Triangularia verruculosa TaxID=2587418 RepID=A0AAN7ARE8_9PEZI|nr:hypothetical protein QBC40DRAFT_289948 [Triangularia verruculosa]
MHTSRWCCCFVSSMLLKLRLAPNCGQAFPAIHQPGALDSPETLGIKAFEMRRRWSEPPRGSGCLHLTPITPSLEAHSRWVPAWSKRDCRR